MDQAHQLILLGGGLLLAAILAGAASSRVGAPLLLVFLALGMLAGEEGVGGIQFADLDTAYLVGCVALAVILFDGGLRTPIAAIRSAWRPASVLATAGVVATAAVVAGVYHLMAEATLLEALLVGSIVASTDAAAVFLLLHQRGMVLRRRVSTTLEVESGVNDPMAVFLTVTVTALIATPDGEPGMQLAQAFLLQLGLGAALGLASGLALAALVNRLDLAASLYPIFVVSGAVAVFGATQWLGGSGFLAVYLAGIVAGNQRLRAHRLIRRFHDGFAWVGQIVLFVMLGLLVTPHLLLQDLVPGLLVSVALLFVARPLAVGLCLLPFRFSAREITFIAWVGLRGAVPIFLAIIPLLGGLANAGHYFNIAFIVVLTSLLLQGWTVPLVARLLKVELPPEPEPEGRLDFDLQTQIDRDIVGYRVRRDSAAAWRHVESLSLPRRARVVAILRENAVLPRQKWGDLRPEDYVLVIAPPEASVLLDRLFLPQARRRREIRLGDFVFPADVPMADLAAQYGWTLAPEEAEMTAAAFLESRLAPPVSIGDAVAFGDLDLLVRDMIGESISRVAVRLEREEATVRGSLRRHWREIRQRALRLRPKPG